MDDHDDDKDCENHKHDKNMKKIQAKYWKRMFKLKWTKKCFVVVVIVVVAVLYYKNFWLTYNELISISLTFYFFIKKNKKKY